MKRIYSALFFIIILPLVFPLFVKAAPPASSNELIEWYHSFGVYGLDSQITNLWNDNQYNISNKAYGILQYNGSGTEQLTIFYCPYATDYVPSYDSGQQNYAITRNNVWGNVYSYNQISCVYNYSNQTYTSLESFVSRAGWVRYYSNNQPVIHFSWEEPPIDFDNVYYSPNIPLPDMDVFYLLNSNVGDRVAMWNANMTIQDNSEFYVQYGIKISIPGIVGIGLDSTTGNYTYSYDEYNEGSYIDIIPLDSLTPCVNISFGSEDYQNSWQSAYDVLYDTVPEFYAKIPFWQQNPTAGKYVSAQTYYKDNMMNQMPMFGNRLEIFARLFTVNEDNQVIVGDWLHWSSRTGSRTQEKPSNYIDNVELPGYVNSSNNVNLESQDNTYQQSGEAIGAPSTVINNNYAPNYPDYPTIVSYNKDNLLLETMGYMSNMNNFLSGPNGFGHFLTEVFTFIPSYVWGMVAMGFGVAIIVMFIKML